MEKKDLKIIATIYFLTVSFTWLLFTCYQQNRVIGTLNSEIDTNKQVIIAKDKDIADLNYIVQAQDKYSIMLENKINYYEEWNKILKDLSQHF